MNVKGLSIHDILGLNDYQLSKMTAGEMKQVTQRLASAANKRIRRLQRSGLTTESGAYRGLRGGRKHKGKLRTFSTDYKNLKIKPVKSRKTGKVTYPSAKGKLWKEFRRASQFLNDKTSTIAGTREVVKAVTERLGKFRSKAQASRFWDAYNAIKKDYGDLVKAGLVDSDQIQKALYDRVYSNGKMKVGEEQDRIDRVIDNMRGELERLYGERKIEEPSESPFSLMYEDIEE